MTGNKIIVMVTLLGIVIFFQDCAKSVNPEPAADPLPSLPATPYNYNIVYPPHIQNALLSDDNTPLSNPITNDGATLGRVLFYDKHLSGNNTTSCSSCHEAASSFSDDEHEQFSKGFEGKLTARNSMAILNLRFYRSGKMFWDERANTLEGQALKPIQDHVEMGLTLTELESKVSALSYYPPLFQKAFGSPQVDSIKIARAISQFERSIVTWQSKYDSVKQGLSVFTPDEAAGEQLFLTAPPPGPGGSPVSCAGCHTPPMFLTSQPVAPFAFFDPNDAGINNQNRFKPGSLRNITQTAPYFHNGIVTTLLELLTGGIPAHTRTQSEALKILAFLKTLDDQTIRSEARFSDPFE